MHLVVFVTFKLHEPTIASLHKLERVTIGTEGDGNREGEAKLKTLDGVRLQSRPRRAAGVAGVFGVDGKTTELSEEANGALSK